MTRRSTPSKSASSGGAARFNISAFYYDYNNYQALNLEGITQIITNNDARMYGVDAELFASPWDGGDIVLGASFLDAEVKDVNVGGTLLDREPGYAPSINLTGLIRQEWQVGSGAMAAQVNGTYVGDHFLGLSNAAVQKEEGYVLLNARLSYRLDEPDVEFALFAKNLTDKEYRVLAFDLSGFFGNVESQYGRPREIGGSVTFRF
jgi:iron complex outermembrane receptor protein